MEKFKIELEWFLNPDHIPFMIGIEEGYFKDNNLDVELIEPNEHYDGFDKLKSGDIALHINEPLHLLEHFDGDLISLGTFFETNGGVLIKRESLKKAEDGAVLKISTPASNPFTDKLFAEIIKAYSLKSGKKLEYKIEEIDFYHIKNLQEGYDGAWLCFGNYEVIEAQSAGLDVEFIDTASLEFPNINALELIVSRRVFEKKRAIYEGFLSALNRCYAQMESKDSNYLKEIYYAYSKANKSDMMDAIVEATSSRFKKPVSSPEGLRALYDWFRELDITDITDEQYRGLFIEK